VRAAQLSKHLILRKVEFYADPRGTGQTMRKAGVIVLELRVSISSFESYFSFLQNYPNASFSTQEVTNFFATLKKFAAGNFSLIKKVAMRASITAALLFV
jgi:hypothetical protein